MAEREYDLGSAELEVLRVLWDEGAATVREVMNILHHQGRQVAYTTVLTFLTRLEQKGFVASDKTDVAYIYKPKLSRDRVRKSRLRNLVRQLYDGAPGPLVLQLVRQGKLSGSEIAELQALIERLDAKKK
ncbi:MAG: BlaI/MecI/CopY family transcriptional regulator [Planctomycetes bacterium]|nr:BlaI/MecI/CopY family transcriptional regulator [Planctomycetota bacterium]